MKTVKSQQTKKGRILIEAYCNRCDSVLLDWNEIEGPCPVCGHITDRIIEMKLPLQ